MGMVTMPAWPTEMHYLQYYAGAVHVPINSKQTEANFSPYLTDTIRTL